MVFSTPVFLYLFFPLSLLLYFAAPGHKLKNILLTVLSLIFYAWGEPFWVILLIISAAVDYTNGRIIGRYRGKWQAKASLICSIVINLLLLGSFKYGNFLIENINLLTGLSIPLAKVTLPIGISFYTFQTMSYSIDVYKDEVKVQKSFVNFLLFVSLFPQLIAGPIVRYSDVEKQIDSRKVTLSGFCYGITRFVCGLGKKVLIANYASAAAEKLLGGNLSALPVAGAWLGILMFAFHIYFDFSGYSDMAIGLGRMFGFDYPENFRYPYIANSITAFWRRWHITLSSFFRDYVYIPLGGNRRWPIRNMLIVWSLTGLWHGASWNFVLWGLYFFVLLCLEKYLLRSLLDKLPDVVKIPWTFLLVLIGWVLFYFTDLRDAGAMYGAMLGLNKNPLLDTETRITLINNLPLLIICIIGSTPLLSGIGRKLLSDLDYRRIPISFFAVSSVLYNGVIFFFCTVSLLGSTHNPFIYFRF
jgi:alginate O-acetyltransferase complex protein AlgI